MPETFDTIVIGGGPGGYVAAIRAAQLGQKTAVVERDKAGGRCLNYACIPAKTILRTAEIYDEAKNGAELGIVGDVSIDWDALQARRAKVSESLSSGVKFLWDKNKITMIEGEGSLTAEGNVVGRRRGLRGRRRDPRHRLGGAADPRRRVRRPRRRHLGRLVAARAAEEDRRRRRRRLGLGDRLRLRAPRHRGDPDRDARRRSSPPRTRTSPRSSNASSRNRGSRSRPAPRWRTSRSARARSSSPTATSRPRSTTSASPAAAAPTPRALDLTAAGVELDESGRKIKVDPYRQTTNPKVFAIGDLVNKKALAHKAEEEGVVAVEKPPASRPSRSTRSCWSAPPSPTRRSPASASPRRPPRRPGHEVKIGKQKISGEGAGTVYDDKDGIVKLVVDAKYGEVLGAHIVGNRACDMIAELVATMALEGGVPGARADRPPAPDGLRGGARRGARRRRLGDPRLSALQIGASGSSVELGSRTECAPLASLRPLICLISDVERATFYYDLGSPYAYLSAERISRALHRGRAGAAGVAADPARRALPALRPRLLGDGPRRAPRGSPRSSARAAAYGLPPIVWPDPWPGEHADRDAGRDLRQADRPHRLLQPRRLPPGLRRRPRPDRSRQRDDRRRRLRAPPAGAAKRRSQTDDRQRRLREATDAAAAAGVFGVPRVRVGERGLLGRRPARGGGRGGPA